MRFVMVFLVASIFPKRGFDMSRISGRNFFESISLNRMKKAIVFLNWRWLAGKLRNSIVNLSFALRLNLNRPG